MNLQLTIAVILQFVAGLCFTFAAFGVASRVNLVAAGLALFMLSLLIS